MYAMSGTIMCCAFMFFVCTCAFEQSEYSSAHIFILRIEKWGTEFVSPTSPPLSVSNDKVMLMFMYSNSLWFLWCMTRNCMNCILDKVSHTNTLTFQWRTRLIAERHRAAKPAIEKPLHSATWVASVCPATHTEFAFLHRENRAELANKISLRHSVCLFFPFFMGGHEWNRSKQRGNYCVTVCGYHNRVMSGEACGRGGKEDVSTTLQSWQWLWQQTPVSVWRPVWSQLCGSR